MLKEFWRIGNFTSVLAWGALGNGLSYLGYRLILADHSYISILAWLPVPYIVFRLMTIRTSETRSEL